MTRSESIVEITKALALVQGKMESAKKDSDNPFYKSKYADLASVLDVVRKLLSANGLAIVQPVEMEGDYYYIETMLMHISGEFISSRLKLTPMRQVKDQGWMPSPDPQSIGVAIAYGRRQALQSLLCIAAEDDDGNAASNVGAKEVEAKAKKESTTNFNFLTAMKVEKERVGDGIYYGVLKDFKVEHSNLITKREDQLKIYNILTTLHKQVKEEPKDAR